MLSFFLANVFPERLAEARLRETPIEPECIGRSISLYIKPPFDQDSLVDNLPDLRGQSSEASILVLNELVGRTYVGE